MHPNPSRASRRLFGAMLPLLVLSHPLGAQQRVAGQGYGLGIDTTNMDRTARPQDDFVRFVNGGWLDKTEIPPDQTRWGAFPELIQHSQEALRGILEAAAAAGAASGTETQKIGDLYASFMDTERIDAVGLAPLEGLLSEIAAIRTTADLPAAFGRLREHQVSGPFAAAVGQDQKDSDAYIVRVNQAGLEFPDRSYYLLEGEEYDRIREAFVTYNATLLELAGQPDPEGAARRILQLETEIATRQWDRVRNRDRDATYNKMSIAALTDLAPSVDWAAFFAAGRLASAEEVIVRQPDYLEALGDVFASTPIDTWKEYLTAHLIDNYAGQLPSAFVQANFEFVNALTGQQEMRPRWQRGVSVVESALGEALGKAYVDRYFPPEAKARMDELVANLQEAFRQGIDELEWMSVATKREAHDKLDKFTVKIGYPDEWKDFSTLEIRRNDLLGNVMRAEQFWYDDMVRRLGQPVDRKEWGMTPQTVNAYYNPTNNEIVFPAAILQPPFFNVAADDAVNYGGIGAVIGHEISHGFDDQGRKSDGDGNLRDWWTEADAAAFTERAERLAAQYEAYSPIGDLHINGHQTLGENIGDLSGVEVAYHAYHISLGDQPAPVIDGFTGDQRFFMGFEQIWRTKTRPEEMRRRLLIDAHSPGEYRAFVPLTNLDAFYRAWDVGIGDGMYRPPDERVKIW